jgi:hypothetical protein
LLETTFTLDTVFNDEDATTIIGLAGEEAAVDLMLLELELTVALGSNWSTSEDDKLLTEDSSPKAWLDTAAIALDIELLDSDVSESPVLLNLLDLLAPSPSTPAAPPQAVNIIERIMPQTGSLAFFSAGNIFLYH